MSIEQDLRKIPLFKDLATEELSALAEATRLQRNQKGDLVVRKGDPGDALFLIRSGKVRVFTMDEEGQEIALNIYGPGDFFGELSLLDGLPRSASITTLTDCELLVLGRDEFAAQLEAHPRMVMRILAALTVRLRTTTERAERMAFLNIYGRIALQLLDLAEEHGRPAQQGIEIDMDLTPEDLASLAGVDLSGLERVLKFYQDAGLVETDWPRLVVRDADGLRQRLTWHRRKRLV
ncbi:MAG: Crp/Fnr family transcriptional regulator [Chloroflexia bacterium]|nr:Crp/Fnr family transcriptional regulator [Chloroflexia bacterium]